MFLLFLIGLGAGSVKAQVRIGGNTPPNPAAALDLNAAEGTTGTKGLALPRVTLSSNTATLDGTTANINGMLVYNTGGSLSTGVYYWNGAIWRKVIASPTGLVDTTMLSQAPANSFLFHTTSGWRTVKVITLLDQTLNVAPNSGATSATFDVSACVLPVQTTLARSADYTIPFDFNWWLNPDPQWHIVFQNTSGAAIGFNFKVQCLGFY